jgi:GDP-D-mannose dehydratase
MPNALILAANTATGAYLSRLVQARGSSVFAVADDSSSDGLTALGITGDVNPVPAQDAAKLAATLSDATIFAINTGSRAQLALIDELMGAAPDARLIHVADMAALRHKPAILDRVRAVAMLRRDSGRRAANALLHAHDSRLGPVDSLAARITLAAFRAGQGAPPAGLEIPETGPQDWGWTPEYVDAVARVAALPAPLDITIGSGRQLDVRQFADLAFGFFKTSPVGHVVITPGETPAESAVDIARTKALTGWTATTWGRDLVHALCEGAASRSG